MFYSFSVKVHSVVSDSLRPYGLYHPWNSPGQNTGLGSLSLLQGIFPTQGLNPGVPHSRRILYQLSHKKTVTEESVLETANTTGIMREIHICRYSSSFPMDQFHGFWILSTNHGPVKGVRGWRKSKDVMGKISLGKIPLTLKEEYLSPYFKHFKGWHVSRGPLWELWNVFSELSNKSYLNQLNR